MIQGILTFLAAAINLYSFMCMVAIIITWFPGAKYTKFGRILSSITDPYLHIFSKSGKLVFGNLDFSPILAIAILSLSSTILGKIAATGRIYFGGILAMLISMLWSVFSTLLGLFIILMLVRWIVLLVKHGEISYDSAWSRLDALLEKPAYKISRTFVKKPISYQQALLVSWIVLCVISLIGLILTGILQQLCYQLPF